MAITLLLVESARKADDHHIAFENRLADLVLPILPGLEVFCIQPGIDPILDEARIEFVNGFLSLWAWTRNMLFCRVVLFIHHNHS